LCGRYANRIGNGRFALDATEFELPKNEGAHTLHGGPEGFHKKFWKAERIDDDRVAMSLSSPDGDMGFPGCLDVRVLYVLEGGENALRIEYEARCDRSTVVNLTNHAYFNLAGHDAGSIRDHLIRIAASRYTVVDDAAIPTGELREVAGTQMDLREPTPIGLRIDDVQGLGYDHNYCLDRESDGMLFPAVEVFAPSTGILMECLTTEPGMQFYTGNFLDGVPGRNGAVYRKQEGFCLEAQHYPDSPNQPAFPSTRLNPGEIYRQTTVYRFGTKG